MLVTGERFVRVAAYSVLLTAIGAAPATSPTAPPVMSDDVRIAGWVDQLSAADPDTRVAAASHLEDLPPTDLPLMEAAFARHDLSPDANVALSQMMPRVRQRAKLAAIRAHRHEQMSPYYQSQALAGYDHGGHTNPQWDDAARAFLRADGDLYRLEGPPLDAARPGVAGQMRAVLATGCNDPTVLAAAGMLSTDTGATAPAVALLFARAARELPTAPGISPLYRLIIDGRRLSYAASIRPAARQVLAAVIAAAEADLPTQFQRLLATPGLPPYVAVEMADAAFDRTSTLKLPLKPILDGVLDPLLAAYPNEAAAVALRGQAMVHYAWEARGAGYADTVTPQGEADFEDRLGQAKTLLSQAYHMDPDVNEAADDMLTVARGLQFDRPTMEMWYRRAIAANPDDTDATDRRLTFLEPKWGGDPDAMLQFGRDVVADGNFYSSLPTILVEAHQRLADHYAPDADAYWLRPGVWDDVRSVYEGYLKRRGRFTDYYRNALARAAVRCHQWHSADEQFKQLGDKADPAWYPGHTRAALDAARQTAARLADQLDQQGR